MMTLQPIMHASIIYIYLHYAVWNELEKENKEFFEAYAESKSKADDRMSEEETSRMIQKMISDSSTKDSDD